MIATERMITYDSREVGSFLNICLQEMSQYHFNNGEFKT